MYTRKIYKPASRDGVRESIDELLLVVFDVLRELGGYFCARHSGLQWQKGFGILYEVANELERMREEAQYCGEVLSGMLLEDGAYKQFWQSVLDDSTMCSGRCMLKSIFEAHQGM